MIILVGGEKGGPGKTTIATNLAAIRSKKHADVLLMDTDRQPTASYWCSIREDANIKPRVASIQKFDKAVRTEAAALQEKYKDIIIDAGGRDSPELRASLLIAKKAIFPLRPSQFDLWTLGRLNVLVESAKEVNDELEAFVVINQASTNPGVKEVEEAQELIQEFSNLSVLKTYICERISFRRAAIQGRAVTEYKPEDGRATEEIISLYREIYNEQA